jgi:DNA polymerase-3 subunit alpha
MPLKFVNLHGHDGHSLYDAIGAPEDYADWMMKNAGEDSGAFAITNHGNMNSIGSMVAAQKKYKAKGAPVKFIYGVEAYYIPSINGWQDLKRERDEQKKLEKKKKVRQEDDDETELVIENEKESKSKYSDPFYRRNHLVLVARDQQGLKNLFKLVSKSYRQGFYKKPRMDLAMLREHSEGIIASTACLAGIPSWCSLQHPDDPTKAIELYDKELLPLMEVFGKERFYLELQFNNIPEQQIVNSHVVEYAKKTGYNLIATADCHYPDPHTFRDREIYRLLGRQMQKDNVDLSVLDKKIDDLDAQLYLKNGDQIYDSYKKTFGTTFKDDQLIIDAIERTYDIGHHLIGNVAPDESIKLPKSFSVTEKIKTPFDQIKAFCIDALKAKGLDQKQEYVDRTIYELKVIKKLGVEEYFLALKQMLDVIREHMLTGVGRGSGVGSLVCYLLNITFLDPIKHGLLFERFLSPSRKEMPDIDSDTENKEQAFEIIKQHFGEENVVAISNYNRLQLKSLIKDISKLYGVDFNEVNACTKVIENEAKDKIMEEIGHDQKLYELTFEKAMKYSPTLQGFIAKYPKVGESIENLYREVKSIGRHAGGLIFVPNAEENIPIIRIRGVDQSPISEGITAQHCKHFGLIKFDMLALATLRIIRRCIEIILKNQGIKHPTVKDVWAFYNKNLHPDAIDDKDEKVFKRVYASGRFPSIFQFEKSRVQAFCMKAEPKSAGDVSAVTALWRPGPLKGKADQKYLWAGMEKRKDHKTIEEILGETRGLLLYQEQFMLLAHHLAGFSLEESDQLRKLLVKPSHELGEEMKQKRLEYGEKFVKGAIERGLTPERAKELWEEEILGFISYGFNKSHSQAYAFNSYHCAWLYTYYEKEWIKACLECDPDLEKTVNVTRGLGFEIKKVDVNTSPVDEWVYDGSVWCPPLTSIKGVGQTAAKELVSDRPKEGFRDIHHFLFDADGEFRWSKFNKKVMESLMKAEAFLSLDCVGPGKLFKNYRHMHDFISQNWDDIKKGKVKLEEAVLHECDDWSVAEKIVIQRELVGFYDKGLVVGKFLKTFKEFDISAIDEYGETDDEGNEIYDDKIKVWGIVEKVEEKPTKHGKPFLTISVSGNGNKPYTFRIWNTSIKQTTVWVEGNVVVFSLDYDKEYGSYTLSRKTKVLRITK